jgi:hypothetical protein
MEKLRDIPLIEEWRPDYQEERREEVRRREFEMAVRGEAESRSRLSERFAIGS